jgi:hypothetical protein
MTYVKKRATADDQAFINRVWKFKMVRVTEFQATALTEALTTQCCLYNRALQFRNDAYVTQTRDALEHEASIKDQAPGPEMIADLDRLAQLYEADLARAIGKPSDAKGWEKKVDKIRVRIADTKLLATLAMDVSNVTLANVTLARIALWKREHPLPSLYDLKKELITKPRADGHPYLTRVSRRASTATLMRQEAAYQAQFRRLQAGENMGELQFKSRSRWNCLEYDAYDSCNRFTAADRDVTCDDCAGKGVFQITEGACQSCAGQGKINITHRRPCLKFLPKDEKARILAQHPIQHRLCPDCDGTGTRRQIPPALLPMLRWDDDNRRHILPPPGAYPCPLCAGKGVHSSKRCARFTLTDKVFEGKGTFPVKLYRPVPEGAAIRKLSVVRQPDGWYVALSLEIPFTMPPKRRGKPVGLDLGIQDLVTASDGRQWHVPGHMEIARAGVARLSRKIAGQVKGSASRRKRVRLLARDHHHVRNCRREWQFATAREIALSYPVINCEHVEPTDLMRRPAPIPSAGTFPGEVGAYAPNGAAAQSIVNMKFADAAIGAFQMRLQSACDRLGSTITFPAPDAQTCSACGATPTATRGRMFVCDRCGNTMTRQANAAENARQAGELVPG